MKRYLILIAAAAISLAAACSNSPKPKVAEEAASSPEAAVVENTEAVPADDTRKFIDFTVEQPDGTKVSLSDYVGRGKYILVDFWASWCGPCRREIPNIKNVYNQFHGEMFDIVSVAVWDKPEDSLQAIQEEGLVWNQIINAGRVPTDLYGIEGIPHLILFGPDGSVVADDIRGPEIGAAVAKALGR